MNDNGQNHLSVREASLSFGGIRALKEVGFDVSESEILAIIGPNGAGKTSLLNAINGFYRLDSGEIIFQDQEISSIAAHKVPTLGIARTFQNPALYSGLTTLDNLMAARHIHMHTGVLGSMIYWGFGHKEDIRHREAVEEIIDFLEIEAIRKAVVGALPYGLRKRVELGRAIAMEPTLMLLDEPMTGMNVEEKEDMARFILDVHELKGTTIVLIEHDMGLVMDIADRVIVLDFGEKIAEGPPSDIRNDTQVINAYLGEAH
jgi:branched-chain amino acid transport system ATP-binding protein